MKNFLWFAFMLVFSASIFAQTPTDHAGRTLNRTSTTGYDVVESAVPSYIQNTSLIWRQSEQGDEGLFFKNQDDSVVIFTNETTVRRFLSPMGNPYRFWQEEASAAKGGFPIPLVDQPTFDNFLQHYQNRYDEGMKWCEVVEDPWGPWLLLGSIPTGYGVQSYTEQRTASTVGKADLACALIGATTETRTLTVDNGPAPVVIPDPVVVVVPTPDPIPLVVTPPCAHIASDWLPDLGGYYNDVLVNQYRTLPSCTFETRGAYGLLTRAPAVVACTNTGWSPDASTVALGQYFTRTDNSGNPSCTSGGYGTLPPVIACTNTGWSPSASGVAAGQLFTQYDSSGNTSCSRFVPGTFVQNICSNVGWLPATNTVLQFTAFTQYDSSGLSHCSRAATGTRPAVYIVSYSWMPTGFLAGGFGPAYGGGSCSTSNEHEAGTNGYVHVCMVSGVTIQ